MHGGAVQVLEQEASTAGEKLREDLPCASCSLRKLNFCGALLRDWQERLPPGGRSMRQVFRTTAKRRNIYHVGTKSDDASIICSGWAFRFVQLPDGRRQILSILIPGDLISPIGIFSDKLAFSVQALTEVRHCAFSRQELQKRNSEGSNVFKSLVESCLAEAERSDSTIVDLGRRSAAERVSRLLLRLMDRLSERGLIDGQSFEFPLRQQHLADATGLTAVHVSRVIGRFRETGLIELANGWLRVLNLSELRRIADMK
jgi:CRP-like cAMP-binding protein